MFTMWFQLTEGSCLKAALCEESLELAMTEKTIRLIRRRYFIDLVDYYHINRRDRTFEIES